MSASTFSADRLQPWIDSLRARGATLPDDRRESIGAAAALLAALHSGDAANVAATLTDDVVIRITGWTFGGSWEFRGAAANAAVTDWLDATGDAIVTMRGDIDRFYPGVGMLGMDGVWSRLDDGVSMTSRRFGWFLTVVDGRVSAMDLYWSIHQQSE